MISSRSSFDIAQRDMRQAYLGGAPGLFASGSIWCAAGIVGTTGSPMRAIAVLLVGGMFIHPIGVLIARLCGRTGAHTKGNPLGALAFESTALLLLGIPLALAVSRYRMEWFFPAMMLVIGGRYLTFATLYGMRHYWACGALLVAVAFGLVNAGATFTAGAFAGGAIELFFAAVIFMAMRGEPRDG